MLLRTIITLIICLSISCTPKQATNKFESEIRTFERSDEAKPPAKGGILFVGSSSIRMWEDLADDFKGYPVINRGFGGSEMSDVLYFFNRIVLPYEPEKIFLYEGDNDLNSGKTPDDVIKDYRSFVDRVGEELPDTRIFMIAVKVSPSRIHINQEIQTLNTMIEAMCRQDGLEYVDIYRPMVDDSKQPIARFFGSDELHMTREGYQVWIEQIRPFLED